MKRQPYVYTQTYELRRLWALVTQRPTASIAELTAAMGWKHYGRVARGLNKLEELGYVEINHYKARARVVVVPFYEVAA